MTTFSAFCPGTPEPQGSTRMLPIGKPCHVCNRRQQIITSDNPDLKKWRNAMAKLFALRKGICGVREPFDCPVELSATLILPRLKRHDKRGEPLEAYTAADLDKLVRAIGDSLQDAGVIQNDARICRLKDIEKRHARVGECPGVLVTVSAIETTPTSDPGAGDGCE